MNYFAHGRRYLHDPYFLAGTQVPDWLGVVDRRVRTRSRAATPFRQHPDKRFRSLAGGIIQHHHDDRWFHQTRAFNELNLQLAQIIARILEKDAGFRPSFLGHILVEILLDAILIERAPAQLDDYYRVVGSLEPGVVQRAVGDISGKPVGRLSELIVRFSETRFLYDYLDDGKLLVRLNHVMQRVGLPALPDQLREMLPDARLLVARRQDELLSGEVAFDALFVAMTGPEK